MTSLDSTTPSGDSIFLVLTYLHPEMLPEHLTQLLSPFAHITSVDICHNPPPSRGTVQVESTEAADLLISALHGRYSLCAHPLIVAYSEKTAQISPFGIAHSVTIRELIGGSGRPSGVLSHSPPGVRSSFPNEASALRTGTTSAMPSNPVYSGIFNPSLPSPIAEAVPLSFHVAPPLTTHLHSHPYRNSTSHRNENPVLLTGLHRGVRSTNGNTGAREMQKLNPSAQPFEPSRAEHQNK